MSLLVTFYGTKRRNMQQNWHMEYVLFVYLLAITGLGDWSCALKLVL